MVGDITSDVPGDKTHKTLASRKPALKQQLRIQNSFIRKFYICLFCSVGFSFDNSRVVVEIIRAGLEYFGPHFICEIFGRV